VSEQQNKDLEQSAEETAGSVAVEQADAPEKQGAAEAASAPAAAPQARKGSGAVAWLALLLALAVAAALAWLVLEQRRLDSSLAASLQAASAAAGGDQSGLDDVSSRLQEQLRTGLGRIESGLADQGNSVQLLEQAIEAVREELTEQSTELTRQRTELARFGSNDRESWLLAEVEYLLRLANQRLVMAGDVTAAQALLDSADNILLELDDASLHGVRAAVAADLASVRAVPRVDVEGAYLRLAALIEQAGKLVIFQLPERASAAAPDAADTWQGRLQQGYEQAIAKLSNYIIIRRRDVPMQALMDPQWEGLVRQNLRMLLEQAQVALLSGNQDLYRESLQRAQHWVAEFFSSDEAAARAMAAEISQLVDLEVAVAVPDLSRSLQALDDVMQKRLQSGDGE
jgi:uroporphyrin-3 C-methyltransferase